MGDFWKEAAAKLLEPFPLEDIEMRIGSRTFDHKKGLLLAYISNRAVMNRLDAVFGINNWQNSFTIADKGVLCALKVREPGTEEWITKEDGSSFSDLAEFKGGISGAMKRVLVQFGGGRYLYDLPQSWVALKLGTCRKNCDKCKGEGGSYPMADEEERIRATFPQWALPAGATKAHWIDDPEIQMAFYDFIEKNDVKEDEYFELFGIEKSMREYTGTRKEAGELLKKFIEEKAAKEEKEKAA